MMTIQQTITEAVSAVAPIHGISFGKANDKATWSVQYKDATPEQVAAGDAVLAAFDMEKEAHNAPIIEALTKIDADNAITQRNLRDLTVLIVDAFKASGLDLTTLKGYQVSKAVEMQAAALRAQLQK